MFDKKINDIPSTANFAKIHEKAQKLTMLGIFSYNKIPTIKYLGGCSNHALVTSESNQESLLIRLPGSQSELLVDRPAEKHNSDIVARLGLAPKVIESHISGELNGYKVEEFLQGSSLTFETFNQHADTALRTLRKVHDSGEEFLTQYNLFDRIILMCETLKSNGINYLSYDRRQKSISLDQIINTVQTLREQANRFFEQSDLVPCHNDISPMNFIVVTDPETKIETIKIIDWEYSGMNDRMVDLAYIASENGYVSREAVEKLLESYYETKNIRNIDVDKILFYTPLIDLKVAVFSLMQVHMRNESKIINILRKTDALDDRFSSFEHRIQLPDYLNVLEKCGLMIRQDEYSSVGLSDIKL